MPHPGCESAWESVNTGSSGLWATNRLVWFPENLTDIKIIASIEKVHLLTDSVVCLFRHIEASVFSANCFRSSQKLSVLGLMASNWLIKYKQII